MHLDLTARTCEPCEGGIPPLTPEQAGELLTQLHEWKIDSHCMEIWREFPFEEYHQTMAFVNAVAWIAHREGHHPDLEVSYNRCTVRYSTHAIGGLSENDFICAAKVEALLRNPSPSE